MGNKREKLAASAEEFDGKPGRRTKAAAHGTHEIHTASTGAAGAEPRLSRCVDCCRRDRRFRQKHATLSAEALAGIRGLPPAFHRVEFLAAGEIGDAARQAAAVVDTHDAFPPSLRRFFWLLPAADQAP